jgi:cyclopropane-fatty-acyl-phospholipid synthase
MTRAQNAKVMRALQAVDLKAGDRLLEIGCGWGALAEQAITQCQAKVTGVTLSSEQLAWAQDRLSALTKPSEFDLRLQDYRDINDAPFDAICSIEMLEAVGQEYWPTYFQSIHRLLKSGAKACIQTIVIQDHLFDRYIRSTDFIQQYIFPGGCLPSPSQFKLHAKAAGLEVIDAKYFGKDYAQTLRYWKSQFLAQQQTIAAQGFDQRFMRIWEFYLAYCEAGFDAGDIDVVQFTLQK